MSRSRSYDKKANFTYFNMLFLCMWLQVIDKVKVTSRSYDKKLILLISICYFSVYGYRSLIRSRSYQGQSENSYLPSNSMSNFTYFNMLILSMWLQVMNKAKFTHQGEGHIKVKVKISASLQILCSSYSLQAGGIRLKCVLVLVIGMVPRFNLI